MMSGRGRMVEIRGPGGVLVISKAYTAPWEDREDREDKSDLHMTRARGGMGSDLWRPWSDNHRNMKNPANILPILPILPSIEKSGFFPVGCGIGPFLAHPPVTGAYPPYPPTPIRPVSTSGGHYRAHHNILQKGVSQ